MTTSRDKFNQTLNFSSVDRPPLFEDGIRDDVLREWRTQGLGRKSCLSRLFTFDQREEIEPNLEPIPMLSYWPKSLRGLHKLSDHLNPDHPDRLPENWNSLVSLWKVRTYPLILRIHRGFFLSLGVHGWHRFTDASQLLVDNPTLIEEWLNLYAEFSAKLAEKILTQIDVDAALFSEPIGGDHGPLISPQMYTKLVLSSYQPIIEVLKRFGVTTIIYRTYANTRLFLPSVVEAGFNCLWACECNPKAMSYTDIRREFGRHLCLIGGIDADSLRHSQDEIYRSMMNIVPPLLEDGGYIPLADGRVREDVTFENYIYYRKLLESVTLKSQEAGSYS